MRDLKVTEVDVGCDACEGARTTSNAGTAFVCGIILGLGREQLSFCSRHYAGFQKAVSEIERASLALPTGSVTRE